jgi:hypothetical protein
MSFTLRQSGSRQDAQAVPPTYCNAASNGSIGTGGRPARASADAGRQRAQYDPRLHFQSPTDYQDYAQLSGTPNPYHGACDSRNEAARSDPRRYDAPHLQYRQHPQDVDADYGLDDKAHYQQGGQIISPRHWGHHQLAQSAGHSPLDAAALGCWEYHGYQRGYYLLTAEIILCCGYRDTRGGVTTYCNDIIFLHHRVMDLWLN